MSLNEFSLIEKYFSHSLVGNGVVAGIGDDCAVLEIPNGQELVTSVDTLVAGVHFPEDAHPADIATRALRVNLSDLAAMGAEPRWFTLALTIPDTEETWLEPFSSSLLQDALEFGCTLIGGDTTAGPLAISLTMFGLVPKGQAILRSGASIGDHIYVTGSLGDSAAALEIIKGDKGSHLKESEYLLSRFYRPTPQLKAGQNLRNRASAMIDISDGLLADLGHIAQASCVGAEIYRHQIPASKVLTEADNQEQVTKWMLTGGDDYELCFTVPDKKQDELEVLIALGELEATAIGRIIDGDKVVCLDQGDCPINLDSRGYQHF